MAGRVWVTMDHRSDLVPNTKPAVQGRPWDPRRLFRVRTARYSVWDETTEEVYRRREADAAFIVAAVNHVRALLAAPTTPRDELGQEAVEALRRYFEGRAITAKAQGRDDRDWLDALILLDKAEADLTRLVADAEQRGREAAAADIEADRDDHPGSESCKGCYGMRRAARIARGADT